MLMCRGSSALCFGTLCVGAGIGFVVGVSPAHAQVSLIAQDLERTGSVNAQVSFDDQPGDCFNDDDEFSDLDSLTIGDFVFQDAANAGGGGGFATAITDLTSSITQRRVDFEGVFTSAASLGGACSVDADAAGGLSLQFTVSEPTSAALSGRLFASLLPGFVDPTQPGVIVTFTGFSPTGGFFTHEFRAGAFAADMELDVFEIEMLYPDGTYGLGITGFSTTGLAEGFGPTVAPDGRAEVSVALVLGDMDSDGLLDEWETDGIDIDEDGIPELDLPAMGANPMRKDLFVEIDRSAGSTFDAGALRDVEAAFANAPAGLITNPDGSSGITLHAMVDETNLAKPSYPVPPGHFPLLASIKAQHFGTPAERASPKWELIKQARLASFRYCVWGGTRPGGVLGFAEIVGDDFTVLIDTLPGLNRDTQAGIFMHEFGHTLGLRHGGNTDDNYKPNYVSIMNYALTVPYFKFPEDVRNSWKLEFSQRVLPDVDENAIDEFEGFGSLSAPELAGRSHYVRVPSPITMSQTVPVIFPLDTSPVDLDLNGDPTNIVSIDVTRDGKRTLLSGFNDWTALNLPLAGSPNFGDAAIGTGDDTDDTPDGVLTVGILDDLADTLNGNNAGCNAADLADPVGSLTFADITAFLTAFANQDPAADLAEPVGQFTFADISTFLAAFSAGCP